MRYLEVKENVIDRVPAVMRDTGERVIISFNYRKFLRVKEKYQGNDVHLFTRRTIHSKERPPLVLNPPHFMLLLSDTMISR